MALSLPDSRRPRALGRARARRRLRPRARRAPARPGEMATPLHFVIAYRYRCVCVCVSVYDIMHYIYIYICVIYLYLFIYVYLYYYYYHYLYIYIYMLFCYYPPTYLRTRDGREVSRPRFRAQGSVRAQGCWAWGLGTKGLGRRA